MPQRETRRPLDWRGQWTEEARRMTEWYAAELRECGALVDDLTARYVTCLPCEESRGEP